MIDKVEAGKTYKLIDKNGWVQAFTYNKTLYEVHFINDKVQINSTVNGYGYVDGAKDSIIGKDEYRFFELVNEYEHLQQINSPFGELDKQTKKDLLCAWIDGAEVEFRNFVGVWIKVIVGEDVEFFASLPYRVKPTISAKEAAKAKLISEAQQQLRDAQEALDKAQQL